MATVQQKLSLQEMLAQVKNKKPEYIRTGCLPFDLLMEGRGLPSDLLIQLFSDTGFGKSTTCLSLAKALADQGKKTLMAAIEPTLTLVEAMGLEEEPYSELFSYYPLQTYTELGNLTEAFLNSDYTLMIIDSISAVKPSKASLVNLEAPQMGGTEAKLSQEFLSILQGRLVGSGKTVIYLNQIRANFGATNPYAAKTVVDGGYASRFYAGVRVEIQGDTKTPDISDGSSIVGKMGYLYAHKNRAGSPFVKIPFQVLFGQGISNIYTLLHFLAWQGIIKTGNAVSVTITAPGADPIYVKGKVARNSWVKEHYEELVALFYEKASEFFKYLQTNPTLSPL